LTSRQERTSYESTPPSGSRCFGWHFGLLIRCNARRRNVPPTAFFDIVEQLAQLSAQNRRLSLPDNDAAGKRMGQIIKEKARADHDQLLYVIVDQAVREIGTKATAPATK
jgi:hypothetical protein